MLLILTCSLEVLQKHSIFNTSNHWLLVISYQLLKPSTGLHLVAFSCTGSSFGHTDVEAEGKSCPILLFHYCKESMDNGTFYQHLNQCHGGEKCVCTAYIHC